MTNSDRMKIRSQAGIDHDLEMLRGELKRSPGFQRRLGIFGLMFVLMMVVGILLWTDLDQSQFNSLRIVNGGVSMRVEQGQPDWHAKALEQAMLAYLDASNNTRIIADIAPGTDKPAHFRQLSALGGQWYLQSILIREAGETSGRVRLRIRLKHLRNENRQFSTELNGTFDNLDDLAARAAQQILNWLDREPLDEDKRRLARAELPQADQASRFYAEGLEALENRRLRLAVEKFRAARVYAGDHPMILAALARTLSELGYRKSAVELAGLANQKSNNLTRQRQLEIEGIYARLNHDWERAAQVLIALKEFHPDDVRYWLDLVEVYNKAGAHKEALQAIAALHDLTNQDPRIDIAEASVWNYGGKFGKALDAADTAIVKARALGNDAILADALMAHVDSDGEKSEQYLNEALALYRALNNPGKQSAVLQELGTLARAQGRLEEAETYLQTAIDLARSVGDEPHEAAGLNALAIVYDLKGELEQGFALKQQVAAYYADRKITARHAIMLENMGISLFKLGRLTDAKTMFDKALPLFAEVDDQIGLAWRPYHLSRISSRSGALEVAGRYAQIAVENAQQHPEGHLRINAMFEEGYVAFLRGDDETAEAILQEVEKEYLKLKLVFDAAETRILLGRIALRRGNYPQALQALQSAQAVFEDGKAGYYNLSVQITMVDYMLAANAAGLKAQCKRLDEILASQVHKFHVLRGQVRQAMCLMLVQAKPFAEADELLLETQKVAAELGIFAPQIEARLARAHLLEKLGQKAPANDERATARALAEAKGWSNPLP